MFRDIGPIEVVVFEIHRPRCPPTSKRPILPQHRTEPNALATTAIYGSQEFVLNVHVTAVPGYQVRRLSWEVERSGITTGIGQHLPCARVIDAAEARPRAKGPEPVGTGHRKVGQGVLDIAGRQQRCRWNDRRANGPAPGVGLFCSTVTGLAALHGVFQLFGSRRVGVTRPTADSLKTVPAYRASVGLVEVAGQAWYLAAAQSFGYVPDELCQPIPYQQPSRPVASCTAGAVTASQVQGSPYTPRKD